MNGRDLLSAISGIDPAYIAESGQTEAIAADIRTEKRRRARTAAAFGGVFAVCAAAFAGLYRAPSLPGPQTSVPSEAAVTRPNGPSAPVYESAASESPGTTTVSASAVGTSQPTESAERGSAAPTPSAEAAPPPRTEEAKSDPPSGETENAPPAQTRPTDGGVTPSAADPPPPSDQPQQTAPSTTAAPFSSADAAPADQTEAPQAEKPGGVFTRISVDYETARERFGHPILPCEEAGFTGFRAGIVSRDGNTEGDGAFCLSVTYVFTNGEVTLTDQDRLSGSLSPEGNETLTYRGRTFYIRRPDVSDGRLRVERFPTPDSGLAYQAFFEPDTDVYAVMDLILSLTI